MSVVALYHCDEYTPARLDPIVRECLSLRKFSRGERVLVKANMLSARAPKTCVATHPALVDSACRALLDLGARPFIGDSPGIEPFDRVARVTGIAGVGERLGVPVRELSRPALCPPSAFRVNKRLELAADALEADSIVSLPKMKTHCQMKLTLAVKNLFGTVPGTRKAQWHYAVGLDRRKFADVLIDILVSLPPVLSIVDGVMGMEGHGPGSGKPRFFGLIGASADAPALDAALCAMLGQNARDYAVTAAAMDRGVGDAGLESVEWRGDFSPDARFENVDIPSLDSLSLAPRIFDSLTRSLLTSRPEQDLSRCVGCGRCAQICPAQAIVLEGRKLKFDYAKCIRCYCCHEMCPQDAILFREGTLMKLLGAVGWVRR